MELVNAAKDELLSILAKHNHATKLVRDAIDLSIAAHANQRRHTGEPYVTHPIGVAKILTDFGFYDQILICAALLHDTIEDTHVTHEQISKEFGEECAAIVEGVTKLKKHDVEKSEYDALNLRKIILASSKDVRVILVKLADRLHNLESLETFRADKKLRIAKNTLDVYAPLAEKVGLYTVKAQLEDMAFSYVEPALFSFIKEKVESSTANRASKSAEIIEKMQQLLSNKHIKATVLGRAKHIYSIYKKMKETNKTLDEIYDLYGIRIIVANVDECYKVMDILATQFKVVPHRLKDFIKHPKANGYQSLHDNFLYEQRIIEVQIRTQEMHNDAESGVASYWRYKENERDKRFERKLSWLRQLLTWKKDKVQHGKIDIFKDEIVVVTPKGDPIILGEGSTPIDLAYMIHSSIGEHIKTAKVNKNIVPLSHILKSGDIVQIETTSTKTVNENWLKIATQSSTQSRIRKSLNIEHTPTKPSIKSVANVYNTVYELKDQVKKMPIKVSQCCSPTATDKVVAFYTKDKKMITVHKFDCPNQFALNPNHQVIITPKVAVHKQRVYHILIEDKPGLLTSVLNKILAMHGHIISIDSKEAANSILISITLKEKVPGLLGELRTISGVIDGKEN